MSLHFDQPEALWLAALAIPILIIGWLSLRRDDTTRALTIMAARLIVLLLFTILLAHPRIVREHDHVTVIGLLDMSGSVKRFADLPDIPDLDINSNVEYLRHWFREATQTRTPDDRFGLIVFDGQAVAISTPTRGEYIDDNLDVSILDGTNIEEAIELGLAMFPADTARRLVLVSDGNETTGDALAAARKAAGDVDDEVSLFTVGVPIDVVPIAYRVERDAQVSRVEAPPVAQPNQAITVRTVFDAIQPVAGTLTLFNEGIPVDLNGESPGNSTRVQLPAGESVHIAQVQLDDEPVNRFEAVFEPDDPDADALIENNRAEAFTAVPSKGRVLFVNGEQGGGGDVLARTLQQADIRVVETSPEAMPTDMLQLQSYDLIIFQNVAASSVPPQTQETIARVVHDLGVGFIMIGGDQSFGAGGWNGTPVEEILPVELDLPKEIRLPRAAVVLVLDKSGSMRGNVAGARATKQEVANRGASLAIQSLQKETLVGVVAFDSNAYVHVELQENQDPDAVADRILGIIPDGGTNIAPALITAHDMLRTVEADKKRVVLLSDGRSSSPESLDDIVLRMRDDDIQLTSIAVGDQADQRTLLNLAELGEGEFYFVSDPYTLPNVLVDSVQVINRPLLKEVPFTPVVLPTGSTLSAGMGSAPQLGGVVITAPRDEPLAVLEMTNNEGDPLFARWQAGLGQTAAFTSDAHGDWSNAWLDWQGYTRFWTQLVRQTARATAGRDYELTTRIEHDQLDITLEATDEEGDFLDYAEVTGTVYTPSGEAVQVRLRQTAPGHYAGFAEASEPGNYIVALMPRQGAKLLPPVIGGISQPAGVEFRRYRSNISLLEEIARATNGRLLRVEEPREMELYDRSDLPRSVSALPAWRTFLPWLIALMLFDVACRRIAWDRPTIQRAFAAALAKVTPSRIKGEQATGTLATLRSRNQQFEQSLARDTAGYEKLEGQGGRFMIRRRAKQESPDEAQDRQAVSEALDRLAARPTGTSRSDPQTDRNVAAPSSASGEQPASEREEHDDEAQEPGTTGGLLAAKRRARERYQKD